MCYRISFHADVFNLREVHPLGSGSITYVAQFSSQYNPHFLFLTQAVLVSVQQYYSGMNRKQKHILEKSNQQKNLVEIMGCHNT